MSPMSRHIVSDVSTHDMAPPVMAPPAMAPPAGLEPAHPAPEAGALSAELRGHGRSHLVPDVSGDNDDNELHFTL